MGLLLQHIDRCEGASQNPHADFMCKIRQMQIKRAMRISTSYYSYCDST